MDEGITLALSQPWWSWNAPVVHKALITAHRRHWLAKVKAVLKTSGGSDEQPAEWQKLSALRRNPRNIRRVLQGESAATSGFLLGVATIFGLEVRHLYPDTAAWLAGATATLCEGVVSNDECTLYVAFVLWHPMKSSALSQRELEERLQTLPAKKRSAVLRVARALAPTLRRADRKLQERETSQ